MFTIFAATSSHDLSTERLALLTIWFTKNASKLIQYYELIATELCTELCCLPLMFTGKALHINRETQN